MRRHVGVIIAIGSGKEIECFMPFAIALDQPSKVPVDRTTSIVLGPAELDPQNLLHTPAPTGRTLNKPGWTLRRFGLESYAPNSSSSLTCCQAERGPC